MPSSDKDQPGSFFSSRIRMIFLVLLLLTTFLSAFCAYQANSWSGVQSAKYQEATKLRTESVRAYNDGNTQLLIDLNVFLAWSDAAGRNDTIRTHAIASRFTPEFKRAFTAWIAQAPPDYSRATLPNGTPFMLPEYHLIARERGALLEENATAAFMQAQHASDTGTSYVLVTLFFAIVLFLCGVGEEWGGDLRLRKLILGAAVIFFCTAVAMLLLLPKNF
jgi:hypothetical protein